MLGFGHWHFHVGMSGGQGVCVAPPGRRDFGSGCIAQGTCAPWEDCKWHLEEDKYLKGV